MNCGKFLHIFQKNANTNFMINYYKRSLKEFKRYVKNNPKVNMNEWDNYAHNNCLFSAFTLACHKEVYSFKELIRKI